MIVNNQNLVFSILTAGDQEESSSELFSLSSLFITVLFGIIKLNSDFKGSSDLNHFIFEINVGKRRIRQRTTLNLKLNDAIFNRFESI